MGTTGVDQRPARARLAALIAFALCLAASVLAVGEGGRPAQADTTSVSTVTKTGRDEQTGSVATSTGTVGTANPGDTIDWVVNYKNNTGVRANVSLTDTITGNQTYVDGSLTLPPGFTGAVNTGTVTATAPNISPSGNAAMTFVESGTSFQSASGGDGFNVMTSLAQPDNIYTSFHHNTPSINCINRTTGGRCAGWTTSLLYFDFANPTGPLLTTSPNVGHSNYPNMTVLNQSNGRIYETVYVNRTTVAVICYNPIARTGCGILQQTTVPTDNWVNGNTCFSPTVPGSLTCGTSMTGLTQAANNLVYWLDYTGTLHCFDPASNTGCGFGDNFQLYPPGTLSTRQVANQNIQAFGPYVFTQWPNVVNGAWHQIVSCYNTQTHAACTGFASGIVAPTVFTTYLQQAALGPILDAAGTVIGICSFGNGNADCYSATTGAPMTAPALYRQATATYGGWYQQTTQVGTKSYLIQASGVVVCFDWATNAACPGFTGANVAGARPYTLVTDVVNPTCLWVDGDAGQLIPVNAITGSVGCSVQGSVTANPQANYCDGTTAASHGVAWSQIVVTTPPAASYRQLAVTIRSATGAIITDSTGAVWDNRLVASTAVPINLAGIIGYSSAWSNGRGATYDTTSLFVSVAFIGATTNITNPQASVTWTGDDVRQVCFKTRVAEECGTFAVTNSANAVTNATANGGASDAPAGNGSGVATFNVTPGGTACSLHISKTSNSPLVQAGQSLVYTITITNTGTSAYTASAPAIVDDDLTQALTLATYNNDATTGAGTVTYNAPTLTWTGPLAPGASTTITYSMTANAGAPRGSQLVNTISSPTATTNCPTGSTDPACTNKTTVGVPGLSLVKSANPTTVRNVGDVVQFRFLVTNSGNVALTDITIDDTLAAPAAPGLTVTCPLTFLAAGASMTCTAPYTVTQADVDAGTVVNTATATGTPPFGPAVTTPPSTAIVVIPSSPAMTVQKIASAGSISQVGQQLHYTIVVRNTGNTALNNIVVTDRLAAPAAPELTITCPATTLAVGTSMTCTAGPYTVTAADLANGKVVNTADAAATPPNGPQISAPPSTVEVPTTSAGPSIAIQKTAVPTTAHNVGDVVQYDFVVRNTGGTPLTGITVVDTFSAPAGPEVTVSCPQSSLPVGGEQTCTSSPYRLTAADVANGSVDNSATATGADPDGNPVTSAPSAATVTVPPSPSIGIVKSATPTTVQQVGQVVTFRFVVTNTGNVSLTGVAVVDTLTAPASPEVTVTCPSTTLAVGASMTCVSSGYRVTQADLDNGAVNNSAVATGTAPGGAAVGSTPSTASVPAVTGSALSLVKTAAPTTVGFAGQTVTYGFQVTNTGNTTLTNLTVTDTLAAPAGPALVITCPSTSLAVGATVTCTARYTVTQADVDNGRITNTATATGTDPNGQAVTTSPSTAVVTIPAAPATSLVKSASPATFTAAGQQITYSFLVTNTGNVPLTGITVSDVFTAPAGPAPAITCPTTTLAAGASTTCTATYTTTQNDVDNGSIANTATARGTAPDGTTAPSNPSSARVPVPFGSAITIAKSVSPGTASAAGQRVAYRFLVTNTGRNALTNVVVTDTFTAPAGPALTITCPSTTLAAGTSMTCTAPYTITQADVNRGAVDNSATAAGTDTNGSRITSAPSTAVVTIPATSAISLSKVADRATTAGAGDVIRYSFLVSNTGNVPLTGVAVADQLTAPAAPGLTISCPATTLAVGASMTCTASYTVTQADVDNGAVRNTATATGTPPVGQPVSSAPSTALVTIPARPALAILKTAAPAAVSGAGQRITYSFLVTNTGNVPLTGVTVADQLAAPAGPEVTVTCPSATLAAGASMTCASSPYTATAADVGNGSVNNSATASGATSTGATVTSPPSTTSVPVPSSPAISVVKSADASVLHNPGDTVTYTFVVTNTGSAPLTDVTVDDQLAAPAGPAVTVICPSTTLAAGASMTCTAGPYTVTQADADSGGLHDTATATGTPPTGPPVQSPQSTVVIPIPPTPALTVAKTASPSTATAAGQEITYSFLVTNTGNVTLTTVTVTDQLATPAGPELVVTCPATTLAAGASTTCTATYTTTQADVDNGEVVNTATATGTPPSGPSVTTPVATATVPIPPTPALAVAKTASPSTASAAGQEITYSFLVTNTGNVTLTTVTVTDTLTAPAGPEFTVTCPSDPLPVGASTTCTGTYTTTQADVDNGQIVNTAVATGTAPDGTSATSPPSTATVTIPANPSMTLVKSSNPASLTSAGQALTFVFAVTNTGNVTLTNIAIDDQLTAPAGPAVTVACPSTTLAVGASMTCTAPYTATQTDVDHGSVTNTATAAATTPDGGSAQSPPSVVVVPVPSEPALTIVKTANPATVTQAGQTVAYSFLVANTGNVTVTGVTVTDQLTAPAGPEVVAACPFSTLPVGASMTCTATYTATQADVDHGAIDNSAVATGTTPTGATLTSPPSTAHVDVPAAPSIGVVKSADVASIARAGDVVNYSFVVTNTGNVTLTNPMVTDTLTAPAAPELVVACPPATLAPNASVTCTATYTATQADVDHGSIDNSAVAAATTPTGTTVTSPPSTASVAAPPAPGLAIVKTADVTTATRAGDVVNYTFVVTNTGNVTITGLAVTDTLAAPAAPEVTVTCSTTILAPGASATCTASAYTVTQADVDSGSVANSAVAGGTTPDGIALTSPPSAVTVPIPPAPGLDVVKSADPTTVHRAGDTITYSFVVTNTGNVTITGVAVTDLFVAPAGPELVVTCPSTTLAPGASVTCTAPPYTVTQPDVDHGFVDNSAVAGGTAPDGSTVTSQVYAVSVPVPAEPGLAVVKSADPPTVNQAGDVIDFTVVVTNTGNVTLTSVTVTDQLSPPAGPAPAVTCPSTTLAPGTSMTCTVAPYTVTQADADNGAVTNTATAGGTAPGGGAVDSAPSTATVPVPAAPALSVVKTANTTTASRVGEVITYTIAVTNTGNVTLTTLMVTDTLTAPAAPEMTVTCPGTSLPPTLSMTCTAAYTVTQADLDHGSIANSATATGTAPDGSSATSPPSTATVRMSQAPALTVVKTAGVAAVSQAGDTIDYSFLVTNTGNVTLTTVTVTDTLTAPAGPEITVTCPSGPLAVGASTTCTATYTVTQADVDHGMITNSAVSGATAPDGSPVTSPGSTTTVPVPSGPGIAVVKTADRQSAAQAGETIDYTFTVTNNGNVSLTGVVVDDVFTAPAGPAPTIACPATALAVGESMTCTAAYVTTQADVDHGQVVNTATATGTPPTGAPVTSPPSAVTVAIPAAPTLLVGKTFDVATVEVAGDIVNYTVLVTNTGNVSLTDIALTDLFSAPAGPEIALTCPGDSLAPGASMTCTASPYVVTQADVDHGSIINTVTGTSTAPDGSTVTSRPSTVTVLITPAPGLTVVKTADLSVATRVGEVIHFSFAVTNTGNVSLTDVTVADTLTAPAGPEVTVTCPGTTLAVAATMTCTADYTVTQADVDNGKVTNTASATGTPPDGTPLSSTPSEATVAVDVPDAASGPEMPDTGAQLLHRLIAAALLTMLGIGVLVAVHHVRRRRFRG